MNKLELFDDIVNYMNSELRTVSGGITSIDDFLFFNRLNMKINCLWHFSKGVECDYYLIAVPKDERGLVSSSKKEQA